MSESVETFEASLRRANNIILNGCRSQPFVWIMGPKEFDAWMKTDLFKKYFKHSKSEFHGIEIKKETL